MPALNTAYKLFLTTLKPRLTRATASVPLVVRMQSINLAW